MSGGIGLAGESFVFESPVLQARTANNISARASRLDDFDDRFIGLILSVSLNDLVLHIVEEV